jgi:hypothetical protein
MSDDYAPAISKLLLDNNIRDFHFSRRSKHRAVVIRHGGLTYLHCFPSTPSDVRGLPNTLSDLRRRLNLRNARNDEPRVPVQKKTKKSRRTATETGRMKTPRWEPGPPREDRFYAPLLLLQEHMMRQAAPAPAPAPLSVKKPSKKVRLRTPFLGHRVRFQEEGGE